LASAALASRDSWCIGADGPFWHNLFCVDAARGDLEHFKAWSRSLDPFCRAQAVERLAQFETSLAPK
jgi:hypothetical protein